MPESPAKLPEDRAGVFYAGLAYIIWGIMPLYWRLLPDVSPVELTLHRVLWCALFVAGVTAVRGHLPRAVAAMRDRRMLATLAFTSLLIATNWGIYIYCVVSDRLVEASLGYYITPLISIGLGLFFFSEHISRLRAFCIALASVGVILQVAAVGHVPWIALFLAVSFALYGYFRKRVPVAALDGLFIETALLLPVTIGLLAWWGAKGTGAFGADNLMIDALLIAAGPLTAVPLAMFAAGARRIHMSTMGFLQYIAPSITLLLAIFIFHEKFTAVDLISFACVWVALAIVALEGRFPARNAPVVPPPGAA